jgi:hypothetical protein
MLNLQVGGQNLPKMVVPEVSKLPMFSEFAWWFNVLRLWTKLVDMSKNIFSRIGSTEWHHEIILNPYFRILTMSNSPVFHMFPMSGWFLNHGTSQFFQRWTRQPTTGRSLYQAVVLKGCPCHCTARCLDMVYPLVNRNSRILKWRYCTI